VSRWSAPRLWCAVVGGLFAAQGVWAFLAPRSFYDTLATFEPFNAHFIRDVGTIQVGVGVAGVVGALRTRGLVVGLAGLAAFQVLHVVSHGSIAMREVVPVSTSRLSAWWPPPPSSLSPWRRANLTPTTAERRHPERSLEPRHDTAWPSPT